MAAVYLDSVITEYYTGSAWVDITAYVVGDIKGNNGLGGWRPDQRVAVLGTLNITLNNKSKIFSPMGGDAVRGLATLTGFNKGAKIRVRGLYDDIYHTIWSGRIANIDSDDKNWGNEQVRLMAVDWMNVPVNYPMAGATIALNQRIDQAMTLILARLSQQPEATDFDTGSNTFPAVFDNVQRKTMALSEFTKLANSELGYIYVKQDGTLVAENMLARTGGRALDQVWIQPAEDHFLLMEDVYFLLLETGGKIILDEGTATDAAIATDAEGYNILLGEDDLLNASIIRAHPVITDTSLKVLYELGTPLFIPEGQTVTFSAHYTDPSGLSQVSGTNMQAPVATTDYLANTNSNGSGTNKTADQTVTATYYGDIVEYSIFNNADQCVYITFLQARGYGIYYGNSIESSIDDATSQAAYGYTPFQFDQRYQKNTYLANMYGLSVIEEYKMPKSRITQMNYLANLNKNHMMSFLVLTIGSLILGTEDRSGLSNHYYITDRAFTIKQGGIINVEYGVKQNDSYLSGSLNPVTVEFGVSGSTDVIDFGNLPQINGHNKKTISLWIYPTSNPATSKVFALFDATTFGITTANLQAYWYQTTTGTFGIWTTPTNSIVLNQWNHIVFTRDISSDTLADPIIYINGVSKIITETLTPTGITVADGNNLFLGNAYNQTFPYYGRMFDFRVYNSILTPAEVTTLYNSGVLDESLVSDGIAFQGPAIYADKSGEFPVSHVLTSTDRLVENAVRAVATPHGAPIIGTTFGYLGSLLHMNGADASTILTDESGKIWTARGNAQIDTAQYKFGGASVLFGSTGDYIDTPDHPDFAFGSGDFTIDFWALIDSEGEKAVFGQMNSTATATTRSVYGTILKGDGFYVTLVDGTTTKVASKVAALDDGAWHHFAMIKVDDSLYAAVDGVLGTARDVTGITVNDSINKFAIGRMGEYATNQFIGWVDEFRISVGVARWTANFTPPTAEY